MVYGITAYYDASSKEEVANRPLVVVGVAGTACQWAEFEKKWAEILEEKNIQYFDTSACSAWSGRPYEDWNRDHDIRVPFLNALAETLKATAIQAVVAEIVPADFDAVNRVYVLDKDENWPSPYPLVTQWCIEQMGHELAASPFLAPGFRLAHVIEYGDKGQGVIKKLLEREALPISIQRKWDKETGDKVHAFAGCDLLAFYARQAIERRIAKKRKNAPAVVGVLRQIPFKSVTFNVDTLTDFAEKLPDMYPRRS